jgi:hypothetical protein
LRRCLAFALNFAEAFLGSRRINRYAKLYFPLLFCHWLPKIENPPESPLAG